MILFNTPGDKKPERMRIWFSLIRPAILKR